MYKNQDDNAVMKDCTTNKNQMQVKLQNCQPGSSYDGVFLPLPAAGWVVAGRMEAVLLKLWGWANSSGSYVCRGQFWVEQFFLMQAENFFTSISRPSYIPAAEKRRS